MYLPEHFKEVDPAQINALMEGAPLACIVAQTAEGLIANHLPIVSDRAGVLIGHVALANDMHRLVEAGQDILVIFKGADGYVSPNFYPSKQEHHRHVPTWNYQVAHVHGQIAFQHDERSKRAAVGLLTREQERALHGERAWRMADAPDDYMTDMLGKIVAFRITVTRIIAKSKLSQNRMAADYAGAVAGIRAAGNDALAAAMEARADGPPAGRPDKG